MRFSRGNEKHIARPQSRLLIFHHKQDLPFCHIGDLLVRVRMGRVWLLLGAIVKIYDDQHQVVGMPKAPLGTLTDRCDWHLAVF
jgi:hypothetical protein